MMWWSIITNYNARDKNDKRIKARCITWVEADSLLSAYTKVESWDWQDKNPTFGACLPGKHLRI
jgi:hypothetical protein